MQWDPNGQGGVISLGKYARTNGFYIVSFTVSGLVPTFGTVYSRTQISTACSLQYDPKSGYWIFMRSTLGYDFYVYGFDINFSTGIITRPIYFSMNLGTWLTGKSLIVHEKTGKLVFELVPNAASWIDWNGESYDYGTSPAPFNSNIVWGNPDPPTIYQRLYWNTVTETITMFGSDGDYLHYYPSDARSDPSKVYGILQETGTAGQIKKAVGVGGVSSVHSGLTIGADYYFQTTSPFIDTTISNYYFGKAISATEIEVYLNTGTYNTNVMVDEGYEPVNGDKVFIDSTTNDVGCTLSSSPNVGDRILFIDSTGNLETNTLTIYSNGLNIQGVEEDIIVDVNWAIVEVFYTGASYGWTFRIYI